MLCKINVDFSNIDLDKLLEKFDKYNCETCLSDDCIFVYSSEIQQTRQFSILLEEEIKNNFFIKEIKDKPVANPQDFIVSWQIEKLEEDERLKIEAENQAKLRQMLDNIEKASNELKDKIKKNGGAVANG